MLYWKSAMKEITVISGKGGTGKTSITAAIASVADHAIFCDNDVDASDLHLILTPEIKERNLYAGAWQVNIDVGKCRSCNICLENCGFQAISVVDSRTEINPYLCEGCRLCERLCPEKAIQSVQSMQSEWYVSDTRFGPLIHARMGVGEENSGKLVSQIRKKAQEIARLNGADYIINDGPPGIGCAVISSLSGVSEVLLVAEPSMSGLHDLKRLVKLIRSFGIKMVGLINKFDIDLKLSEEVESFMERSSIPVVGKIPYNNGMVSSLVQKKTIVEHDPESEISQVILNVWNILK